MYAEQQRYDEADALFARSLAIREKLHARDPESPLARADLAAILVAQGNLYRLRGDAGKAEEAWRRAVATIEPVTAGTEVVKFLQAHATALLYLDRVEEARPLADRLLIKGWTDPDFLALCRRRGLAGPLIPG